MHQIKGHFLVYTDSTSVVDSIYIYIYDDVKVQSSSITVVVYIFDSTLRFFF